MDINFEEITENMRKIQEKWKKPEQVVPPAEDKSKSIEEEIEDELKSPHNQEQTEDTQFITKCYKWLHKLNYVKSQYQFSEQFLNKNRYYYGMILCEQRQPSVDSIHNLVRNISMLNDGVSKRLYLDRLYEEGQSIITKRLLKYL